jgi:hypothetical protein
MHGRCITLYLIDAPFKINTKIFEFAMKIMKQNIVNVNVKQLLYRPVTGPEVSRSSRQTYEINTSLIIAVLRLRLTEHYSFILKSKYVLN